MSVRKCPVCGHEWQMQPVKLELRDDDIMGQDGKTMAVKNWSWRKHISRTSGKEMLAVSYYPADYAASVVVEYLPVMHDGYAGQKSRGQLVKMAASAGVDWNDEELFDIEQTASMLSNATPPREIEYRQDGKFVRVIKRRWERDEATA